MKQIKRAFTMIELLIVIVMMGILAKFGTELLLRTYEDFIVGTMNNRLLAQSEGAVTQIANRLQYRVKESMVVRQNGGNPTPLANTVDAAGMVVFEWIGYDIDGMRGDGGNTNPTWSGFIDVDNAAGTPTNLVSPGTSWNRSAAVITSLSPSNTVAPALFFIGDESVNVTTGFGWNAALANQNANMHRVAMGLGVDQFAPSVGNFAGVDVYEFYRLAWTAYALELFVDGADGRQKLRLWYDYRPWAGQVFNQGTSRILMEDVSSISFASIGDALKVQVCVSDRGLSGGNGALSVCKEKTIF